MVIKFSLVYFMHMKESEIDKCYYSDNEEHLNYQKVTYVC